MEQTVVALLKRELDSRKKRNPAYSLRSFARNLDLSAAQLSQIISGKRTLTIKTLNKVVSRLNLSPSEKRKCWQSFTEKPQEREKNRNSLQLQEDQFRLISDWYHLAILSLCHITGAKNDPQWVSDRLGIPFNTADLALERLTRLGLIASGKKLVQISDPLNIVSKIPSESIRRFHKQILNLGLDKIDNTDINKRDYSAVCFPFNPENIDEVRQLTEKFQTQIQNDFNGNKEVYVLAVQLFPVTENGDLK